MTSLIVAVLMAVGVAVAGGFLVWFGAAKVARRDELARAVARMNAETAPRPMTEDESVAYLLALSQLEEARGRRTAEQARLAAVSAGPRLPEDVVQGEVVEASRRSLPVELRSSFDDPPSRRVRDDRGEMDGDVKILASLAALFIAVAVFWDGAPEWHRVSRNVTQTVDSIGAAALGEHPPMADGTASKGELLDLVKRVQVIDERPEAPGYDREKFGTAWTDDTAAPGGGNECDTRNDVLDRDLTNKEFTDDGCVVTSGTLKDPYTGKAIEFDRDDASAVQIDHIVPLSTAWDMGAARWESWRREEFANDVRRNLLAVDGPANMAKSDSPPSEWLPPRQAYRCEYLTRYLNVVDHYDLAITDETAAVVKRQAPRCGHRGRS